MGVLIEPSLGFSISMFRLSLKTLQLDVGVALQVEQNLGGQIEVAGFVLARRVDMLLESTLYVLHLGFHDLIDRSLPKASASEHARASACGSHSCRRPSGWPSAQA